MVQIIGAGPVGNYTAFLLAKAGFAPTVHEEHSITGKPVQCTGIMTAYLSDLISLGVKSASEEFLVNTITGTRVFGPGGESVFIKLKKNYIVDRHLFDAHLAQLAQNEGATYAYNSRFVQGRRDGNTVTLQFADGTIVHDDTVVGADGPSSLVARSFGLYGTRRLVVGVQARMKMKHRIDPDIVDFYVDKAVPGYIGWLVPENETIARVGVAAYKDAHPLFQELVRQRPGDVLEWQSGMIPRYDPSLCTEDRGVYLVGDAATMVKATTYGGIIPGMHAGAALCEALDKQTSYQRRWKRALGFNLWMHLRMRRAMDKFSEKQYRQLLAYARNDRIASLLGQYDREYMTKLAAHVLLREPRFLRFLPYGLS